MADRTDYEGLFPAHNPAPPGPPVRSAGRGGGPCRPLPRLGRPGAPAEPGGQRPPQAGRALDGALAAVGDDPQPSMDVVADVMAATREVARAGIEVCDLAMEVAGGVAFRKGSVIERCYRDIRAIKFHPLTMEQTLTHAGRVALGLAADDVL